MQTPSIREHLRTQIIEQLAPMFRDKPLAVQRATLEQMSAGAELPEGVRVEAVTLAGRPAERVTPVQQGFDAVFEKASLDDGFEGVAACVDVDALDAAIVAIQNQLDQGRAARARRDRATREPTAVAY